MTRHGEYPPYLQRGWGGEGSIFSCKNRLGVGVGGGRGGNPYMGIAHRRVENCFPLMYGFCSNNALYSGSLYSIYYSFNSFWYMRLLLFQNKSHPVDVYKSDPYKKGSNIVVGSFEHEGITFPHPFIFVLIPYFIGVILSKKKLAKVGGWGKG